LYSLDRFDDLPQDGRVKALTSDQLQSRKDKAVRFLRNVLGDEDRADEVENESLEDYAARRRIQIINPATRRTANMTVKTKVQEPTADELLEQIAEKADEALDPAASRKDLVEALQDIYGLASNEEDDGANDEGDEEDQDEGDD
jgi:hypothetical protein